MASTRSYRHGATLLIQARPQCDDWARLAAPLGRLRKPSRQRDRWRDFWLERTAASRGVFKPARRRRSPARQARSVVRLIRFWIFLDGPCFAAKARSPTGWISLDFLGFSRAKQAFSMGYARFLAEQISRALPRAASPEQQRSSRRCGGGAGHGDDPSPTSGFPQEIIKALCVQVESPRAAGGERRASFRTPYGNDDPAGTRYALSAIFRPRACRRAARARPARPINIMAQVDGSGATAAL